MAYIKHIISLMIIWYNDLKDKNMIIITKFQNAKADSSTAMIIQNYKIDYYVIDNESFSENIQNK